MNYIFGPVPSRRLGRSLGVDLIPLKTCTLSCRYCQIGDTPVTTMLRKSWVPLDDVLRELRERLSDIDKPDWITFSGSGEPTLSSDLGRAIRSVKSMTDAPVCVITNGTLLWMEDVRKDLLVARCGNAFAGQRGAGNIRTGMPSSSGVAGGTHHRWACFVP